MLNTGILCYAGMTQRPCWRCFRNYQITLIPNLILIGMNWLTKPPLVFLMPESIRCYGAAWRMVILCLKNLIKAINLWSVSYSGLEYKQKNLFSYSWCNFFFFWQNRI